MTHLLLAAARSYQLHLLVLLLLTAAATNLHAAEQDASAGELQVAPEGEELAATDAPDGETEPLDETLANEIDHLDYLFTPGHIFPIFGTHPYITEGLPEGGKLPLPYGITAGVFSQSQNIQLTDFKINTVDVLGLPVGGIPEFYPLLQQLTDVKVHIPNDLVQKSIRADAWILPIVNVFAIWGEVEGDVSVDIEIPRQSLLGGGGLLGTLTTIPQVNIPLFDVHYYGEAFGLGYTVALGYKRFFITWTEVETETDLESDQGFTIQSQSHVLNPRTGWIFTPWLTAWVGGLHLEVTQVNVQSNGAHFIGDLDLVRDLPLVGDLLGDLVGDTLEAIPLVNNAADLDFEVSLQEEEKWNYLAGANITIGPHISIELEAGWGVREYWLAGLGFRF